MNRNFLRIGLLILFLVLGLVLVRAKIVGSGTAVPVSTGGGAGTVTTISEGQGVLVNPNPLVGTGTISLRNATQTLIGGINVFNCTGNGHISGFFGNMTPFCSDNNGNGTVTSISQGTGMSFSINPITTSGTINLAQATTITIGGVKVANCTAGSSAPVVVGWKGGNAVQCGNVPEATNVLAGTVIVSNCSAGFFNSGWTNLVSGVSPRCTPVNNASFSFSQITLGTGLESNETPLIHNATLYLKNASLAEIGGILASNCTSGQGVIGIGAGGSLVCGSVSNSTNISMQLLYSNNTDLNLTSTGDCYKYELPTNNYSQIVVTGYGGLYGDNAGSPVFWNTTINFSDTVMEEQQVKSGSVITTSWILPVSLSYTQTQQSSLNITMRSVEVTDGGSFVCKSFYVWGVNNASGSSFSGVKQITLYEGLSSNETPITSNATLLLNNASELLNGGVKIFNCSSGFHVSGWFGNMTPFCSGDAANGTVTSISQFEGITLNPNPITGVGNVLLSNATTTSIGGSRVLNCSGNGHVSGWDDSMNPICSANNGNGTITSISSGSGITLNPDPITSTGTVMATNATLTVLGVTKLTNCSTGFYLNGWNATNIPNCVGELNNGTVTSIIAGTGLSGGTITSSGTISLNDASPKQPYFGFSDRIYAWLRPNGTTSTIFYGGGWNNFVANGTPNAHALNEGYYVRYASAASINGSAGLTQTNVQTQGRYLPIIRTSIMTNSTNSNIREYFGLSDVVNNVYFSRRGTGIEYSISYDTNASNTAWQCCSNDGAALGKTCTAIAIDHTINSPYNLTLNLSNIPTDFQCQVQNNTAISTITKSSNIPSTANNAINLGVQNVAMAQTASAVNYAIRYMYLESK